MGCCSLGGSRPGSNQPQGAEGLLPSRLGCGCLRGAPVSLGPEQTGEKHAGDSGAVLQAVRMRGEPPVQGHHHAPRELGVKIGWEVSFEPFQGATALHHGHTPATSGFLELVPCRRRRCVAQMEDRGNGGQVLLAARPAETLHEIQDGGPVALGGEGFGIGRLYACGQQGQAVCESGIEQALPLFLEEAVEGYCGGSRPLRGSAAGMRRDSRGGRSGCGRRASGGRGARGQWVFGGAASLLLLRVG